ncbi:MAG: glycosyltransferase family 2 protein, partial [Acidobacteria bacterium]|nr:glycosyltransferase family 2 protein [Acidobacteriota bacterium]
SVVIPAFNEAERLPPSLRRICSYLDGREASSPPASGGADFEVIVVDDGSQDDTAAAARDIGHPAVRVLELGRNCGKGAAVRHGVLASLGDRVLLSDADLSTPIEDLERLEEHAGEAEVVLGSRAVADANVAVRQPLYRELMGKTFNLLIRTLGMTGIRDTQCGFKLLDGEVARELFRELTVDRFAFDVELVLLARRRGYRVAEVGVTWRNSPASRVNAVTDSLAMFRDVLRLRLRRGPRGGARRRERHD